MKIVDLGAGDATKNDINYVKRLMERIPHGVVVKFQLFKDIPGLTPLDPDVFIQAWAFGQKTGHKVTASVFDFESTRTLSRIVQVPFIKIACRPEAYSLIELIPHSIPILVSVDSHITMMKLVTEYMHKSLSFMCCIPEYPATEERYEEEFSAAMLRQGISDHTTSTDLYKRYRPIIWERHLSEYGPDVEHSITIEELHECIE